MATLAEKGVDEHRRWEVACRPADWRITPALPRADFWQLRQTMALQHCKWDPQVGDVATLAPFAIVLPRGVWSQLASLAEALAAEAQRAESEILQTPRLLHSLGMPRALRRVLADRSIALTPALGRVVRFDFHPTPQGWRISEANSDVPGGYTEASALPRLFCQYESGTRTTGDPLAAAVELMAASGDATDESFALLAATGFMEDQQIVACVAAELLRRGRRVVRVHPRQVEWRQGWACLEGPGGLIRMAGALRFYQAEWLPRLGRRAGWEHFVRGGLTPVLNPASAVVVESKRFPLVWDELATPLPAWSALLPPSRDPRSAPWQCDDGWLIKSAYCNTGDTVAYCSQPNRKRWRQAALDARLFPGRWVAQERFETIALDTPLGPLRPCLGVYTINGRAAGIYGRLTPGQVVDYQAIDVAVLVPDNA